MGQALANQPASTYLPLKRPVLSTSRTQERQPGPQPSPIGSLGDSNFQVLQFPPQHQHHLGQTRFWRVLPDPDLGTAVSPCSSWTAALSRTIDPDFEPPRKRCGFLPDADDERRGLLAGKDENGIYLAHYAAAVQRFGAYHH